MVLIVGISFLILLSYFLFTSTSSQSTSLIVTQHEYEKVTDVVRNFLYTRIPNFEKTYGQLLGDMVVNGGEDVVDYGERYGGINVTKIVYEYFDSYYPQRWMLNLTARTETTQILWIPNSGNGNSISKVSTNDGRELGRYFTVPSQKNGNPSRVSIDTKGNVWVGNRGTRTLVKIGLKENNQCIDKNGNGRIDTSFDINDDGEIQESEMLPFGSDECLLAEVFLGGNDYGNFGDKGVRAVCVDERDDSVYAGLFDDQKLFHISSDGKILKEWNLKQYGHPYGCFVDKNGNVWISLVNEYKILKFDPINEQFTLININHYVYGIAPCYNEDCLVINSWQHNKLTKVNTTTNSIIFDLTKPELYQGRGIIVDEEGNIYAVSTANDLIVKYDKEGNEMKRAKTCDQPAGIGIDQLGKIWVACLDSELWRFDKNLEFELGSKFGTGHYVYNFFTSQKVPPITLGKSVSFGYPYSDENRVITFLAPLPVPSWRGEVIYLHFKTW